MDIIKNAQSKKRSALTEYESKEFLKQAGIPVTEETPAASKEEALAAAETIGYPLALKGISHKILHKTESGIIELNISNKDELLAAYERIMGKGLKLEAVLVQEMIEGKREFLVGLIRDAQFGPCVMFGLGGIFTEVLHDSTFRAAPISELDADEMISDIHAQKLLDSFRGYPPVDRKSLCDIIIKIGEIGMKYDSIKEIDINPIIIRDGKPVAADALIILD